MWSRCVVGKVHGRIGRDLICPVSSSNSLGAAGLVVDVAGGFLVSSLIGKAAEEPPMTKQARNTIASTYRPRRPLHVFGSNSDWRYVSALVRSILDRQVTDLDPQWDCRPH